MSKKISTKMVPQELSTLPVTGKYYKWCPYCKKHYYSDSRRQRYCKPEHAVLANKRKKEQKERYQEIAPIERLRVRFHQLSTELYNLLVELGLKPAACKCGATENLEVHHKDLNWTNLSPANLVRYCNKHHAEEHARLEKELHEKGILVEEYYPVDFAPLAKIINKQK